jgi:CheY-like chemotaxis protein
VSCDDGTPRARAGEVVLAVEDDPTVRSVAVNMLRELGYGVIEASDGPTALEALDRAPRVDLLFTDLAMPGGLNGRDLIREATKRETHLKALLTSAYTDQLWCETGSGVAVHLLAKPYRESDLARAVRAVLDST